MRDGAAEATSASSDGRGEAKAEPKAAAQAEARAEAKADAALVAGMRRGEAQAFAQFFERFAPILGRLARRMRGRDLDAAQMATDVLTDVATRLVERPDEAPMRLAPYLTSTLVRQLHGARQTEARHRRLEQYGAEELASSAERVLRETISYYAVRSSVGGPSLTDDEGEGPGGDSGDRTGERLAPALRMLARALEATFSPAERDLATLLSAGLTQTNVATALGISYGAARVRIHRLRRRMWTDAADVAAALPPAERAEVHRFLRRAGGGDSSAAHSTMDLHVERDSTAAAWMSDGSGDAPSGHHSPSSTSDVTGAPATRPRPLERPT